MDPMTLPLDYAAIEKILPHRYPFLLEHARVRQGLRHVHRKLGQNLLVAFGECAHAIAQQIQRAHNALLVPQRNRELGADAWNDAEVPWIRVDVVDENGPLLEHGGADNALAQLQPEIPHDVFRVAFGIRNLQILSPLIEKVDREHRERRQPVATSS